MQYQKAEDFVWNLLETKLPSYLSYHGIVHTEKVLEASIELAKREGISDEEEMTLLKTAALFHDLGFTIVYDNHEEEGCKIAKEQLPKFGYNNDQIDIIVNMIMKTKLPQEPVTRLENILCDADLYYLGSENFDKVADKLFKEWKAVEKIKDIKQWKDAQIKFLESHHFWTASAEKTRGKLKAEHLKRLKAELHQEL